tara:strand:- start:90829 stop:91104 length:276 start_codon:yes stop_codon:yes gene_type:complete
MKITKSRLKEIIMEEISYLEQREINVPGLYNISPAALKQNVTAMFQELSDSVESGDYEKVYSILSSKNHMDIALTKVKALLDDAEENGGAE